MNHMTSRGSQRDSSSSLALMIRLTRRCWSSESRIWKPCVSPASRQCSRSSRCAMPWNVPIQSTPGGAPRICSTRPRISPAALLVKVTARMEYGEACSAWMSQAMRWVSTRVLPLPAPASTSTGTSGAETAARCASFRGLRMASRYMRGRILRYGGPSHLGREPDQRDHEAEQHGPDDQAQDAKGRNAPHGAHEHRQGRDVRAVGGEERPRHV